MFSTKMNATNPSLNSRESILEEFMISTELGFLLPDPLTKLAPPYDVWQSLADEIPDLLAAGQVRDRIEHLPVLPIQALANHKSLRLAHSVLTNLVHAFIWCHGENQVPRTLPCALAMPLSAISDQLGIYPVLNHATCCLNNYTFTRDDPRTNMRMLTCRFTHDYGNDWFFLNTAQVELAFAPCIEPILDIIQICSDDSSLTPDKRDVICQSLRNIHKSIVTMRSRLADMSKYLSPQLFYTELRPYLSGYTSGLYATWNGIIFAGTDNPLPQQFTGGSAAQSPTLQVLDALFGIEHTGHEQEFLMFQRKYMLPAHSRFIVWIGKESRLAHVATGCADIRQGVQECIQQIHAFRTDHIQMVTRFILIPKQKTKETDRFRGVAAAGTGGTEFMQFLKQVRNDSKN